MPVVQLANGKNVSVHDALYANILVAKKTITKDLDHIFLIVGDRRCGKSSLACTLASITDPKFSHKSIHFTPDSFIEGIQETPQYSALDYDEAMTGMQGREFQNKKSRLLNRVIAECGQKNLFLFICITDFHALDSYVVNSARCLIQVYFGKNFERGFFAFYGRKKMRMLYHIGKKMHDAQAVQPDFRGRFVKSYGLVDEELYRQKKVQYLSEHLRDEVDENDKFRALLSWVFKDHDFSYPNISEGLKRWGIIMNTDALKKVVQRYCDKVKPSGGIVNGKTIGDNKEGESVSEVSAKTDA